VFAIPGNGAPRRGRMTSPERRAAIVEAATRLFSERGFRGTTTRDLAAAVGVSEPVLYEHFQSKRHLYRAIIEARSQEGMERAAALLAGPAGRSRDREFFTTLAGLLMDRYASQPGYIRLLLFLALEGDELSQLYYRRQILAVHRLVADYLRKRVEEGAFRRVDPALAARAFLAMIVHHTMLGLFFRDRFVKGSRAQVIQGLVGIFLQGVRA